MEILCVFFWLGEICIRKFWRKTNIFWNAIYYGFKRLHFLLPNQHFDGSRELMTTIPQIHRYILARLDGNMDHFLLKSKLKFNFKIKHRFCIISNHSHKPVAKTKFAESNKARIMTNNNVFIAKRRKTVSLLTLN